jgi:hypothetical protein
MKDFIRKRLREDLQYAYVSDAKPETDEYEMGIKEDGSLPNRHELISLGVKSAFETEELAAEHLDNLMSSINSLPQSLKLYRVVFVDDPKQIDQVNVGSHYVMKMGDLEQSHHQISHVGGGQPYILTVKADKTLIDIPTTLSNNMQYPHENEITLKNKGKGAKIVKVEPFQETGEDDLLGMTSMDDFGFDY